MSLLASIVIPTYQRADMLDRLLSSVRHQNVTDFEVIVVNDGSLTGFGYEKVIAKYEQSFFSLVYLENPSNRGPCYSRNRGIRQAKADWVALVDDDDEWLPTKLERQIARLKQYNDRLGLVYTWTQAVKDNEIIHSYDATFEGTPIKELLKECFIPSPSVLVRKQALLDAELFDENFPSCQDWDMWLRVLQCGYECAVVPSYETIYHKHSEKSVGSLDTQALGQALFRKKHSLAYLRYLPLQTLKGACKKRLFRLFS